MVPNPGWMDDRSRQPQPEAIRSLLWMQIRGRWKFRVQQSLAKTKTSPRKSFSKLRTATRNRKGGDFTR